MEKIDKFCVDNLRYLTATTISNAKSGHTGISLGATPIFYSLYANVLKFAPSEPAYFNRDRFVMCAGHASALEYVMLHAFGFNYSIDDLKHFRKLGSKTKGHPSVNPMLGIDASGGPLGQGIPMAVGMAIAEKKLADKFNKEGYDVVDHYTYAFAGDGSLMEGMTNEACSLAGTLKLNKLIVLYDSNNITIEGGTAIAFTEDSMARYRALGWNTLEVADGNDVAQITKAIIEAKQEKNRPTIIKINTRIGYGTPLENNCKIHGLPLSAEQLQETKKNLNIESEDFVLPDEVYAHLKGLVSTKEKAFQKEKVMIESYKKQYPFEYEELMRWLGDYYSKNVMWDNILTSGNDEATRITSKGILNRIAEFIPNFLSGSADLSASIGTKLDESENFSATNLSGRNLCFGVREHAMASICNGIALHGGFRVACSTFMVFSDYMRHAIRMSALMGTNVIYLLSHDSIAVGQDGATHQPIEFNAMYRATPNLNFIRPADQNETVGAYKIAIESTERPTIIALTRQNVKNINLKREISCGAYRLDDFANPDAILISSGSEVAICYEASQVMLKRGKKVAVVSMPCKNLFEEMPQTYKEGVMDYSCKNRMAVEASSDDGLYKYIGLGDPFISVHQFGHTGNGDELMEEFGFTSQNIVSEVEKLLK